MQIKKEIYFRHLRSADKRKSESKKALTLGLIIFMRILLGAALVFAQLRFELLSGIIKNRGISDEAEKYPMLLPGKLEENIAAAVLKLTKTEMKNISIFNKTATYRTITPDRASVGRLFRVLPV